MAAPAFQQAVDPTGPDQQQPQIQQPGPDQQQPQILPTGLDQQQPQILPTGPASLSPCPLQQQPFCRAYVKAATCCQGTGISVNTLFSDIMLVCSANVKLPQPKCLNVTGPVNVTAASVNWGGTSDFGDMVRCLVVTYTHVFSRMFPGQLCRGLAQLHVCPWRQHPLQRHRGGGL